ncbi:hypothetical protein EVAR_18142_1 [Eumeta japonica]|uniref:Uncharacterized protein n=1 Tax=Eumeta variegata TaxID=151549 RepID=A0A4C1UV14_EUMVA|nr:hypothetical protein EVAR_18142_1 [Eumeta japonica]
MANNRNTRDKKEGSGSAEPVHCIIRRLFRTAKLRGHVLVHEFMSIYYALAGWSGNREKDERERKEKRKAKNIQTNFHFFSLQQNQLRNTRSPASAAARAAPHRLTRELLARKRYALG